MADLKVVARVVSLMAESMIFNLEQLPADKLNWKPNPASKSALDVTGEVVGVMRMMLPAFRGEAIEMGPGYPPPAGLEDARKQITEASAAYAAALEAAGPELERSIDTPFGTMWGTYLVTFGMIDLIHHHGQITYLQSLLGDAENHFQPDGLRWFVGP